MTRHRDPIQGAKFPWRLFAEMQDKHPILPGPPFTQVQDKDPGSLAPVTDILYEDPHLHGNLSAEIRKIRSFPRALFQRSQISTQVSLSPFTEV